MFWRSGDSMSVSIFDSFLTTPDMIAVFDDAAMVAGHAALRGRAGAAQAAEGLIPPAAASAIGGVCNAQLYDIPALIARRPPRRQPGDPAGQGTHPGGAVRSEAGGAHVHWGSTSQDVIDTAMVLATREALALLDAGLDEPVRPAAALAEQHLDAGAGAHADAAGPGEQLRFQGGRLAGAAGARPRTPARGRGRRAAAAAGRRGRHAGGDGRSRRAVVARMAASLGLQVADAAWHTQRDEWVRLGWRWRCWAAAWASWPPTWR
jgi:3-carboxy-cis,cis-muconate cycloisomerase